jgi:hypothetical protein
MEEEMSEEPMPATERSRYSIGNVGSGARVAQGDNISWIEGLANLREGESLTQQFSALLERIANDASLDEDTRELAKDKTKAIAEGFVNAQESPGKLRRALLDAQSWFSGAASWVSNALGDVLRSDAAQKTINSMSEGSIKAAIDAFLK